MGTLYIVATPIGNLADITFRALKTLKEADVIACEDTRQTLKLLNHYEIQKPLVSCRSHNESIAADRIIELLQEDKTVAYVSDAGTPGLSDPGGALVHAVREAGFEAVPIPGVSAFAALMSVGSFPGRSVLFDGFLSPKAGKRKKRLEELLERGESFVLYESPHRIIKLLTDIADVDPERLVLIGREMTKFHEEYLQGSAQELLNDFSGRESIKGEFSVLVSGKKKR
ncbi:16S rRNA (cytidine(1402)-2'-O)-methyltransferase [Sediminispirochaeta smaragdinae]|jgi:16S rRNA (cytidine1402-2'-O)-methyltransferase|uniref:Ribosomal RNA small subunit methyltransferase I n=1 Tax=Sediminispirochaeta smaragdinae (strain DSM 11293 / JCM 15392 / SEBR 4228) TaxID=573413 RepID=E1RAI0_SEDSS|nr:16S rRNA (cytidine(1402)-2'-O)-methyltransferase [Sediminispirochaeta smaragdinae]ADK79471.1 Uroporphyrin-III C/tetrapyrrole (Corrin/Porphyrin) methyltransferase [Sediminispirochaeta smaragdinae DSM 11293]